jgi:hypothetical protein
MSPVSRTRVKTTPCKTLFVLLSFVVGVASAANVDLTLYNSAALLDSDSATPLEGTSSSGDLVQLVLTGANGVPDLPFSNGAPGGDDTLLASAQNPTFVGAGTLDTNTGFFSRSAILYDDSYVGSNVFVRFWNDSSAASATYYGDTAVTNLPAADGFGQAELDVVPTTAYPRATTNTTAGMPVYEVPTLSEWGMIVLVAIMLGWGARNIMGRQPAPCPVATRRGW